MQNMFCNSLKFIGKIYKFLFRYLHTNEVITENQGNLYRTQCLKLFTAFYYHYLNTSLILVWSQHGYDFTACRYLCSRDRIICSHPVFCLLYGVLCYPCQVRSRKSRKYLATQWQLVAVCSSVDYILLLILRHTT